MQPGTGRSGGRGDSEGRPKVLAFVEARFNIGDATLGEERPMAELTIRGIPQEELDALSARGQRHGRTAEEEARHLLHEAAAEQLLVMELERATKQVEERLRAAQPPVSTARAAGGRRRYQYEPTPRRR
jgi:plasmid stability protein